MATLETAHPPHNLPPQPNPFIGREKEIAAVSTLLRQPNVRLVMLTGPGGTGKTRLSLQVGAAMLDSFADGVFFVALAPIFDPTLVVPTIATTLGVTEGGRTSIIETLHNFLVSKHMLLIMDNFEQVVDAAPYIAELLAAAPSVRMVASSRQLLHIKGEKEYAVPPLAVPNPAALPPLPKLADNPAVAIFMQRAQLVKPDFALAAENAKTIVAICARLDGLPLAIELAAARIRQFPPDTMLPALDHSLDVLTHGGRDRSERQQTLRGLIEWSYGLLSVGEQALFARLGVFVDGCTLAAAQAICNIGDDLPISVAEGLAALVDKNLLRQVLGVEGSDSRYVMLATIREYALYVLERLAPEGEAATIRRQHAQFYTKLVEESRPALNGTQQGAWLACLEADHDNIRMVLGDALKLGDIATAGQIGEAMAQFWEVRGHYSEGRRWLDAILAHGDALPTELRADILTDAGRLAMWQSDYAHSLVLLEESLTLWDALGRPPGTSRTIYTLGTIALSQGDFARSVELADESLVLERAQGDKEGMARTLLEMGRTINQMGDYPRAWTLVSESLDIYRELGDTAGTAFALINLGIGAYLSGDADKAQPFFDEGLRLCRGMSFTLGIGYALVGRGDVALIQKDIAYAKECFTESLRLLTELGEGFGISYSFHGFGCIAGAEGQPERAARLFGAAQAVRIAISAPISPGERPVYEGLIAPIRAQLDEATWTALWNEGLAMPQSQAMAYALTA